MQSSPKDHYTFSLQTFHVFHPASLDGGEALTDAVSVLQDFIDEETSLPVLRYCLQSDQKNTLEFVLSAVRQNAFDKLTAAILKKFPTTIEEYTSDSSPLHALSRLSLSLWRADLPGGARAQNVDQWRTDVERAPPVLAELVSMLGEPDFLAQDENDTTSRRKSVSRPRRQSRAIAKPQLKVDDQAFRLMSVQVPSSRAGAETLARTILSRQRDIMQQILVAFRSRPTQELFRELYLRENIPELAVAQLASPTEPDMNLQLPTDAVDPTAYAIAPTGSLKADLSFDTPSDFGEWHLYPRRDAAGFLSKIRHGDPRTFDVLSSKLKELSEGRFSRTTQKKLTFKSPVDIFEARCPGDMRIVYQVDWIPEPGIRYNHQVLTIYGFYNHIEVKRENWDDLGCQIAAKNGSRYVKNCRARNHPRNGGDDVFAPMYFDSNGAPAAINERIMPSVAQLRSISSGAVNTSSLAIQKYTLLSQNVWSGILAGKDLAHVFRISEEEQAVVEHTDSCYVIGRSGTGKTTTIVLKIFGIEKAWANLAASGSSEPRPRQMFITKSRHLAEKVENDFVEFLESLTVGLHVPAHIVDRIASWAARRESSSLWSTLDDRGNGRPDLPAQFSELSDVHFPLFITTDDLFLLLEADFETGSKCEEAPSAFQSSGDLVTYSTFREKYWPHFPQSMTSGLSPSLVFSEIIGLIKGSEGSLAAPNCVLDRQDYERKRDQHGYYALFEAYSQRRVQRRERDAADRTHEALRFIQENGFIGRKVDYLYIDEVQDNLLIDLILLRILCANPRGLFWAGDTAQTIAAGSAFRFQELKAFLYRYEKSNAAALRRPVRVEQPPLFQLLINYRSQGSIVRCAQSIIDLLRLFPRAVDKLEREKGIIAGDKPLFINDTGLGPGETFFGPLGDGRLELGSNQCILVRDHDARVKLKALFKELGTRNPVLTIEQSKGLEFDDVLVYHFFEQTYASDRLWRHLINAAVSGGWSCNLDEYLSLVTELKHLYVAVTRAKKRLWIVDHARACAQLKDLWIAENIIDTSQESIARFAISTQSEGWRISAENYLRHQHYEEAADAFDRAQDPENAAIARAFLSRQEASQVPTKQRRQAYVSAAVAFLDCASNTKKKPSAQVCYAQAGDCYEEVGYHKQAAEAYYQAEQYTKAARQFFDANMLDESVSIVKDHAKHVDESVRSEIVDVARYSYLEDNQLGKAAELFPNAEERAEFMLHHDFGDAHVAILSEEYKFAEAGEQCLKDGKVLDGVRLLLQDTSPTQKDSQERARDALVAVLWQHMSFGMRSWLQDEKEPMSAVLSLFGSLGAGILRDEDQSTIRMVESINSGDRRRAKALVGRDTPRAVLIMSLDFIFDDWSHVDLDTEVAVLFSQQRCITYAYGIHLLALDKMPWNSVLVRTLFGVRRRNEDLVTLIPGTFLYDRIPWNEENIATGNAVPNRVFADTLRRALSERLQLRVKKLEEICARVSFFNPCLRKLFSGHCDTQHFPPRAHQVDEAWYHRRILFHLQIIVIVHYLHVMPYGEDFVSRIKMRRKWLRRLESALNPMQHLSGSIFVMRLDQIPKGPEPFAIIRTWIEDVLFSQNPRRPELYNDFLTNFLNTVILGLRLDKRTTDRHLHRVSCINAPLRDLYPDLVWFNPSTGRPQYVMRWIVSFLKDGGRLDDGIRFVQHIYDRKVPVALGTLCSLLDRICAIFITTKLIHQRHKLGTLIMPRSWITEVWDHFGGPGWSSTQCPFSHIGKPLKALLELLDTDSTSGATEQFLLHRIGDVPIDSVADLGIVRICRCLCVLGMNFNNEAMRSMIYRTITSLKGWRPNSTGYRLRYVTSRSWKDLEEAVCHYEGLSPFDELIQLHVAGPVRARVRPGVRLVVFKHFEDVPSLLGKRGGIPLIRLDHDEPPPKPFLEPVQDTSPCSEPGAQSPELQGVDDQSPPSPADPHDEENQDDQTAEAAQAQAATILQAAARKMLQGRKNRPQDVCSEARTRIARDCLAQVQSMARCSPVYAVLYVGALPRVLVCLQWVLARASEVKGSVKQRRKEASLKALRVSRREMAEIIRISEAATRLESTLQPKSEFHAKIDEAALRSSILDVEKLFETLRKRFGAGI
ncbi:hypothetical protein FA95DRAFT_510755 [Auriscalpium vulgare]|uniref:Uncharacterized protein n=1 Tax=Auriscalpium vulgare TaxID=40419 RepID=A0ACB8RFI1_9AGAM|nr:hypothetical protein FA95DRAFT_510755 [Auriscalpium vulgare]